MAGFQPHMEPHCATRVQSSWSPPAGNAWSHLHLRGIFIFPVDSCRFYVASSFISQMNVSFSEHVQNVVYLQTPWFIMVYRCFSSSQKWHHVNPCKPTDHRWFAAKFPSWGGVVSASGELTSRIQPGDRGELVNWTHLNELIISSPKRPKPTTLLLWVPHLDDRNVQQRSAGHCRHWDEGRILKEWSNRSTRGANSLTALMRCPKWGKTPTNSSGIGWRPSKVHQVFPKKNRLYKHLPSGKLT